MTDPTGLAVHGGRGGTVARVGDLYLAGRLLEGIGDDVAQVAAQILATAGDPALLLSAVRSPASLVLAERALLAAATGPGGAAPVAVRARLLGEALTSVARAYATADAMAAAGFHGIELLAGRVAGRVLAPVLGTAAVLAGALLIITGRPRDGVATAGQSAAGGSVADASAGAEAGAHRAPRTLGRDTLLLLALAGPVLERAVAAVPGGVAGALDPLPGSGAALARVTGTGWPPRDAADAAGLAGVLGVASPVLRDRGRVRLVGSKPAALPGPPAGVAAVLRQVGGADGRSVRVGQVRGADGGRAWVVTVPGTQSWSAWPAATPLDLTGNVHALAGRRTAAVAGVAEAMRAAGVAPGEPVLLAGHSQGGMVATLVAADPALRDRFTVTHVVTAGSPVALAEVPDDVVLLSLEHDEDPVPRLDGASNPDRPNWVTVRSPSTGHPHELGDYVATAKVVDRSDDPSLAAVRGSLAPFLDRQGATASATDVTIERD